VRAVAHHHAGWPPPQSHQVRCTLLTLSPKAIATAAALSVIVAVHSTVEKVYKDLDVARPRRLAPRRFQ